MSEHTAEPWSWSEIREEDPEWGACEIWPGDMDTPIATMVLGKANAERIVACINACAGMSDPAAEIAALRARVAELEAERDDYADRWQKALHVASERDKCARRLARWRDLCLERIGWLLDRNRLLQSRINARDDGWEQMEAALAASQRREEAMRGAAQLALELITRHAPGCEFECDGADCESCSARKTEKALRAALDAAGKEE